MAGTRLILGVIVATVCSLCLAEFVRANPLLVDGARPQRIVVMLPDTAWDDSLPDLPDMAGRLEGVLAVVERDGVRGVFESVSRARRDASPQDAKPVFDLRLVGRASSVPATIHAGSGGTLVLAGEHGGSVALDRAEFLAAVGPGALYRGDFSAPIEKPGEVFRVGSEPARLCELDAREARSRLVRSGGAGAEADVVLADAEFTARLPSGFDARDPPGLVVWCSPTDPWAVPQELHAALDELNLVCIGALNAGNERPVLDRLQLALDATATALSAWPIDSRRVYAVGMSGGAKMAVLLWAGWPEFFSGAVPIVGMASYKNEPAPGGGAYPALFSKPAPATMRRLTDHRLAPMTGPPDFNYDSVIKMAKGLERDRLPVRVFEFDDMAHTMPTPERFAAALKWVDEPYQTTRRAEFAAADAASARANGGGRDALLEVMRAGPWTPAAWSAWERLSSLPPVDQAP